MTSRPGAVHPEAMALAREAAALDARGALAQAIEAWTRAAKRDPGFAPAQLGLAQALLRIGRVNEALPLLVAITRNAPASAGAWLAYGVALSALGRHDDAVVASARAASLAPRVAAVQLGHGDVLRQAGRHAAATDAYRAALALAPDDPDALNKTASMLRIGVRGDEAEALLRKAIARAPEHPLARVNLATLMIEQGRPEGPEALRAAARIADLPAEARREVDDALASLAEREALAAPLAEALARNDPAILASAIRSRPSSGEVDRAIVEVFAAMAGRLRDARPIDGRFARGAPRSRDWPALEAHHNFLGPRTDEAIEQTVRLVAAPPAAPSDVDLDYLRVARVVADPTVAAIDAADPAGFEAWLRLRHAQLVGHRPEYAPGHFKLLNNLVAEYPLVERTPWRQVAPTLRTLAVDLAPQVPAGPWRAVFLYAALVECHPFADGNGRVARLFVNRRLAAAGLFPHLRSEGKDSAQVNMTREAGELEPLVEWLAAGSRYAAELDARWSARTAA